ncbi:putative heat shock protein mitochondrial precursor protein [Erysiphe necator]|uniref:Putative heat shock protein mitochondrial protein n=1 Tax=Uncinula necator TaxID=52586 RepID=A0A0B1NWS3_UNCNE|nr:putative heat shock protein mitochondrial precursor protein [Erysiphe necator]
MQIDTGDSVSRHHSAQEEDPSLDIDDTNYTSDDFFKFEKDGEPEYISEDRSQLDHHDKFLTPGNTHQNEKEMLWAQRSEYSKEIARIVGPDHPSIPTSYNSMEKSRKKYAGGPADPNGLALLMILGPRMMEKLLLNIQYECFKAKIRIPWDEIVHRLEPGCSGPSAVQMLNKMRDVLITEGHMIPPAMGNGIQPDPDIRGYVRDFSTEIPAGTRILRWTETYPNASRSLSDSGFVRGSGNYRKIITRGGAFNKIPRTIEERGHVSILLSYKSYPLVHRSSNFEETDSLKARKVIPEEAYSPTTSRIHSQENSTESISTSQLRRGKPRALWKKPGPKAKVKNTVKSGSGFSSQASSKDKTDFAIDHDDKDLVDQKNLSSDFRNCCKNLEEDITSSRISHFCDSSAVQCINETSSNIWPTTEKERFFPIAGCQHCEIRDENITIYLSPTALAKANAVSPIHHSNISNPVGDQVIDNIGIPTNQLQFPNYLVKSFIPDTMGEKTCYQTRKEVLGNDTQPDFTKILTESDPSLNSWKYTKMVEGLKKTGEGNAIDHGASQCIIAEPSASENSMGQSILVSEPETFNVGISQQYLVPWPTSEATSELQNSITPIADENSAKYEIKSNQSNENVTQDVFYPSGEENNGSVHGYVSKFIQTGDEQKISLSQHSENKDYVTFNKNMFRSSQFNPNSAQNCHFASGGVIFEDKINNTIEPMSEPGPVIQDFYCDSENTVEDDFQISAWQNEFLSEQHDELSEVFKS